MSALEGGGGGGWVNTKTKFLHSFCRRNKNRFFFLLSRLLAQTQKVHTRVTDSIKNRKKQKEEEEEKEEEETY